MVGHEDDATRKIAFEAAIWSLDQLAWQTCVAANMDFGGRPPLGQGRHKHSKRLLGKCDVVVVELGVNHFEREADELGSVDSGRIVRRLES